MKCWNAFVVNALQFSKALTFTPFYIGLYGIFRLLLESIISETAYAAISNFLDIEKNFWLPTFTDVYASNLIYAYVVSLNQ